MAASRRACRSAGPLDREVAGEGVVPSCRMLFSMLSKRDSAARFNLVTCKFTVSSSTLYPGLTCRPLRANEIEEIVKCG